MRDINRVGLQSLDSKPKKLVYVQGWEISAAVGSFSDGPLSKARLGLPWKSLKISHRRIFRRQKNLKDQKMTSMRLVLGEINPKILLILSSLLVLIALYSFKGKAETVYFLYDVEKQTGTIQNLKYGFWLTAFNHHVQLLVSLWPLKSVLEIDLYFLNTYSDLNSYISIWAHLGMGFGVQAIRMKREC